MNTISKTLLYFVVVSLTIQPSFAEPLEEGSKAFDSGNYKLALKRLKPLAKKGNSKAQYVIGYMYSAGLKVSQSDKKAFSWYAKSAASGNKYGQYYLAKAYAKGKGVSKSKVKANEWYLKAADNGEVKSQKLIGYKYESGSGFNQSYEKAAYYYQLAAEQGNVSAAENLAELYVLGKGVPKDIKKAVKFLQQSVDADTSHYVRMKKEKRLKELKKYLLKTQLPGGDLWLQAKAAFEQESSNISANNIPADLYYKAHAKSFDLYTQSANLGYVESQILLGRAYLNGQNGAPKKSYKKALYWFHKAIAQDNAFAHYELAMMYRFGKGVEKSEKMELEWLGKAYEKGVDYAKESYNELLMKIGKKDYRIGNYIDASKHFKKAEKLYNYEAMMLLAGMYENGTGVEKSPLKAYELYKKIGNKRENAIAKAQSLKVLISNDRQATKITEVLQHGFDDKLDATKLSIIQAQKNLGQFKVASYLYERMAQAGNSIAQYELGVMYTSGMGVNKNQETAIKWIIKSAEQNNADGIFILATFYSQGLGSLTKSDSMALVWYRKAASLGHEASQTILDRHDGVAQNQVAQTTKRTTSWKDQQRSLTHKINGENACKLLTKNYRPGDRVDANVGYYIGTGENRRFVSCY